MSKPSEETATASRTPSVLRTKLTSSQLNVSPLADPGAGGVVALSPAVTANSLRSVVWCGRWRPRGSRRVLCRRGRQIASCEPRSAAARSKACPYRAQARPAGVRALSGVAPVSLGRWGSGRIRRRRRWFRQPPKHADFPKAGTQYLRLELTSYVCGRSAQLPGRGRGPYGVPWLRLS